VNPADNLELAKFLEKQPKKAPPEASLRGACGRAYYCAFATARDHLAAQKFAVPSDGQGHSKVIELLKSSTDAGIQTAGSLLLQLRTTRNSADYDVGSIKPRGNPFTAYRAQVAIGQAASIISAIDELGKTAPRLGIP
jgi:hypothetical protein